MLDQELRKEKLVQDSLARQARGFGGLLDAVQNCEEDKENTGAGSVDKAREAMNSSVGGKRDFFGRIINEARPMSAGKASSKPDSASAKDGGGRVWVSFHEGFSNAVRKPITLGELLEGF